LERILSGGQTGVDRAALDVAIELGIEHGGWCPKGRLAEDGRIDDRYRLIELESRNYVDRTRRNVMDADGTLILYTGILQGGTFLTARFAEQLQKPLLTIRLSHPGKPNRVRDWVLKHHIKVMNIAGPRATKDPTIYKLAVEFLNQTLRTVR